MFKTGEIPAVPDVCTIFEEIANKIIHVFRPGPSAEDKIGGTRKRDDPVNLIKFLKNSLTFYSDIMTGPVLIVGAFKKKGSHLIGYSIDGPWFFCLSQSRNDF